MTKDVITETLEKINALPDLSVDNVIEKIESEMKTRYEAGKTWFDIAKDWKDAGFSVNYKWFNNLALLHCAAEGGCERVIDALIKNGANIEVEDKYGQTPLYYAARSGHTGIVNTLIDKGVDIDKTDSSGKTPLFSAAVTGHIDIVNTLIDRGAEVNVVSILGCTPLFYAIKNDFVEIAKILIDKGAEVNETGKQDFSPFIDGVRRRRTPLHLTAKKGQVEIVKALIDKGADINKEDREGRTPLHLAAKRGHVETVKVLIDKGADVNKEDKYGQTPLHLAAECGQVEIVKALVDRGADIDKKDKEGGISLGFAVRNYHKRYYTDNDNHIKMVKTLMGHIARLEAAGLHVSRDNLQLKDSIQLEYNGDIASSYRESFRKCEGEVKKLAKEDKSLYGFLKESNINKLVSIWEANGNILDKFNDERNNLKDQYPEYAYTLINKANEIKKEIFLHNYKPLIDALSIHYVHDITAMTFAGIKAFFEIHKNDIVLELGEIERYLIDFVDFEDVKERHVPRLELYAFAEVIKNEILNRSHSGSKHQVIDLACSSSVDEQIPQSASEATNTIEHVSISNSEHNEASPELESDGNQQRTQPEFLKTNGNSSNIATEGDSTKVSDQKNGTQNNNIQPSSQNEKRTIVTASVLTIAGVALGVAIAVHLEMLAVGMVVGVCCLAAAIIYYCSKPLKSLEDSNFQVLSANLHDSLCRIHKTH